MIHSVVSDVALSVELKPYGFTLWFSVRIKTAYKLPYAYYALVYAARSRSRAGPARHRGRDFFLLAPAPPKSRVCELNGFRL